MLTLSEIRAMAHDAIATLQTMKRMSCIRAGDGGSHHARAGSLGAIAEGRIHSTAELRARLFPGHQKRYNPPNYL